MFLLQNNRRRHLVSRQVLTTNNYELHLCNNIYNIYAILHLQVRIGDKIFSAVRIIAISVIIKSMYL